MDDDQDIEMLASLIADALQDAFDAGAASRGGCDIAEDGLIALSKIAKGLPLTTDYERGIADGVTLVSRSTSKTLIASDGAVREGGKK